jgi:antitoxin component of MazEF toxin-antitoxin module
VECSVFGASPPGSKGMLVSTMIVQTLRKRGNSYTLTIPKEFVEKQGWKVGQQLCFELTPLEELARPKVRQSVRQAFEAGWDDSEPAMRYLADR